MIRSGMERMNREWQFTLYTVSSNPQGKGHHLKLGQGKQREDDPSLLYLI